MDRHEAFIVEAVRSPVLRRNGLFADVHPADLGAHVMKALVDRSGVDPAQVDDVIWGCIDTVGPQGGGIARTTWLAAGFPEHVPGVTIDRQCGSSQQAVHFAAQAVMSGTADLIVVGGVQNMSMVPLNSAVAVGPAVGCTVDPFHGSSGWVARYGEEEISQFYGAQRIADKWGLSRDEMEEFALESHRRAIQAQSEGRFDNEIVPLGEVTADDGPRRDTSKEKLEGLKVLRPGGTLTAGIASQISDGAAAMLVASAQAIEEFGLKPRARVHAMSVRGADPIDMLTAPIPATEHVLGRSGLTLDDIDLFEVNEAFAPVVLAWQKTLGVDPSRVNVNGGAIALGHPIGATGARLMTTMLHELERTGGRYGLQTMCEGGGQANATIIERV